MGLMERYQFVQVPQTVEQYNFAQGVPFLHGVFEDRIVINKFQVFKEGLLCETRSSVEDCDLFLDDVIEWAENDFGINVVEKKQMGRGYVSQIEVQSDVNLSHSFDSLTGFGDSLAAILRNYGQNPDRFDVAAIHFHCDTTRMDTAIPQVFALERRTGRPYESGIYFSRAPLLTQDHLKLLETLEQLLGAT